MTGLEILGAIGSLASIISLVRSRLVLQIGGDAIADVSREEIRAVETSEVAELASVPELVELAERAARNPINNAVFGEAEQLERDILDAVEKRTGNIDEVVNAGAQSMCKALRALRRSGNGQLPKRFQAYWDDFGCMDF